jgi:hypothetical protein
MRLLALSAIFLLALSSPAAAGTGDCGQPRSTGDGPTVADALHILGAALHGRDCPTDTCDVDEDCRVTPRDALRTFRHAIRLDDGLSCSSSCPDETPRCSEAEAPTCGGACPDGYECRPHDREPLVPICHIPPGNPENKHTILVGASAVPAHLGHGDYLGRCRDRDCDDDDRCDSTRDDVDDDGDDDDGESLTLTRDAEWWWSPEARQECRCELLDEPTTTTSSTTSTSTTSSTSLSVTSTTDTTTTITLPSGDEDNDGIGDATDPCLADARNLCAGPVAVDETTGNPIRLNAGVADAACAGVKVDCTGTTWNADFGYNQQGGALDCTAAGGCPIAGVTELFGCTDEATQDLFRCEHWDPPALPDLGYSFDVPDGSYVVNLFFANIYPTTATVGSRVMDLIIEDEMVYTGFDQIAAAAGATQTAVVRSAVVTVDDGNGLQIVFDHVIENPAVKAIEVLTVTAP